MTARTTWLLLLVELLLITGPAVAGIFVAESAHAADGAVRKLSYLPLSLIAGVLVLGFAMVSSWRERERARRAREARR